jgi:hypothetical protein
VKCEIIKKIIFSCFKKGYPANVFGEFPVKKNFKALLSSGISANLIQKAKPRRG